MCDANRFGKYTIVSVAYGDKLLKCHMLFVYCCHQMMSLFYILPLPQMGGNATAHFRAFKNTALHPVCFRNCLLGYTENSR